jgi:glycosyltransferase involved in cell wall biosynthesis
MNIGFDLSITRLNQAGASIYANSLYHALQKLLKDDQLTLFSTSQRRVMGQHKTIATRLQSIRHDLLWSHITLPIQANRARVDILHAPAYTAPLISPCPIAVSILDVLPLMEPRKFPIWQRNYSRIFFPLSAKYAAAILTISEQSKRDIVEYLKVPDGKVTVTYLAPSAEFRVVEPKAIAAVKEKYGIDYFLLNVCTVEPRKNISRTLQAFARIKDQFPDYKLIHAGSKGWLYDDIFAEAQRLGLEDRVQFLGRVPLNDLVALYNAADAFIYPSLYEGFGIPLLEAMACGCPVITSNVSSLPEVAGEAARLVDPQSVDQIADAMTELLTNDTVRGDLREKGLRRAAQFSWSRCAEETLAVYQSVHRTAYRNPSTT